MKTFENISYKEGSSHSKHLLDIYTPDTDVAHPVLLFVHGGSWYYGSKDLYVELGRHLASKGIAAVMVNYRLGPETTYEGMAQDIAHALKWTKEHINTYGGDAQRVFIGGHSAGGHLSALVALNPRFCLSINSSNKVTGCILIDAFGLNIDYAMQQNQSFFVNELRNVFTQDPQKWKDAAPVRFLSKAMPAFLVLTGSNTYPYITLDNELFKASLDTHSASYSAHLVKGKNHMEMVTDLKDPKDAIYQHILDFIGSYTSLQKVA